MRCLGHSAKEGRLGAAAGGQAGCGGGDWVKRVLCPPGAHSGGLRGTELLLC